MKSLGFFNDSNADLVNEILCPATAEELKLATDVSG
jgi:hypothetical protein